MPDTATTLVLLPILTGIITNVLTSLGGRFIGDSQSSENLNGIIQRAISETSDGFTWQGSQRLEEVCLFLAIPEVEQLTEQLFSTRLAAKTEFNLYEIQEEFFILFQDYFGTDSSEDRTNVSKLFELLSNTTLNSIDAALDESNEIFAALLNYRANRLEGSLRGIHKFLESLESRERAPISEILSFESKYREQVASRLSYVKLYNLDTTKRIFIDDIYVEPRIAPSPIFIFDSLNTRNLTTFLDAGVRLDAPRIRDRVPSIFSKSVKTFRMDTHFLSKSNYDFVMPEVVKVSIPKFGAP